MSIQKIRTYSELLTFPTFKERYAYLRLSGKVCDEKFGFERYLNQTFYKSEEWLSVRRKVIIRDNGCDLGVPGVRNPRGDSDTYTSHESDNKRRYFASYGSSLESRIPDFDCDANA